MMRGPSYDDNYIARKMTSMQNSPTFCSPGGSLGRGPLGGYAQNDSYEEEGFECTTDVPTPISRFAYTPSAQTKLILSRVARTQPRTYNHVPPPRCAPRMAPPPPSYYDDYYGGYGGYSPYSGYGYGGYYQPPPPPMRYSGYSPYVEDDYEPSYIPRYRPLSRLSDSLLDIEAAKTEDDERTARKSRLRAIEASPKVETEGDRHMARMSQKYPSLSEPQMLQDQVDKMRIRLKALSYTLDPSGPVPEIVIPTRARRVEEDLKKKYTSALELEELPRLSTRKHRYYPEDEHMKDNLRIKCLSHYKSTRTQAEYWQPKAYKGDQVSAYSYPSYSFRTPKLDGASKWEEPDKVYATSSTTDKKPFSKVETGSSFFNTYGYTSRLKDTVAEKCRDYYYYGDEPKTADATEEEDTKKERRKKKKSREHDELAAIEAISYAAKSVDAPAEPAAEVAGEATEGQVSAPAESVAAPEVDAELDEKERKKMEKKKRKAEREAAAKAAMEAELAALAQAEAELAKLEAESASIKVEDAPKAAPADQASEPPAEKCESQFESRELECEPSSFAVNESLQDHEMDRPVLDDPAVVEDTYEAAPVEDEAREEQPKVSEEEICEMLEEETVPPQVGDGSLGTEEYVELSQEPAIEEPEPQVEIEPHEQPEEQLLEMEQPAQSTEELEQPEEPQQELVEEPVTEYPEETEQPLQPEEAVEQQNEESLTQQSEPVQEEDIEQLATTIEEDFVFAE